MVERVQRVLNQVPGYTGYRAKERRRDEDRAVREQLADALDAAAASVEALSRDLANQRRLNQIQPVEALFQRIGHLASQVRTATYGYAGLFSDQEIDELALDQLRRFDEQALVESKALSDQTAALRAQAGGSGDLAASVSTAMSEVDRLASLWDHRGRVIESARPSAESEVIALLEPAPAKQPGSGLTRVAPGDALAVLGDDFIVAATVIVEAPPHILILAQLNGGSDWLMSMNGPATIVGRVSEVAITEQPQGPSIAEGDGRSRIANRQGGAGDAAVRFAVHEDPTRDNGIAVTLDWGRERRVYRGTRLHANDVDVFGQPTG